jgi:hypothetical protein
MGTREKKYSVQEKYWVNSLEKLRLTGKERKDFLLFEQLVSINIGQTNRSTFYKEILFREGRVRFSP